jgi:hypothetical protein
MTTLGLGSRIISATDSGNTLVLPSIIVMAQQKRGIGECRRVRKSGFPAPNYRCNVRCRRLGRKKYP